MEIILLNIIYHCGFNLVFGLAVKKNELLCEITQKCFQRSDKNGFTINILKYTF